MQSDTVGWLGSAGASFRLTDNSQKITQLNVNAHIQYKTEKNIWLLIGNYGLLKAGGNKFIKYRFGHLRYNHKLNSLLRWEVFTQAQDNYITSIAARYLLGTGPRFKLADTKSFHLYIASLFMYEYEEERTLPKIFHNDIRNSSYVSFTIRLNQVMELISTTFYQPLLKKMSDFRILNETSLRIKTGKHLGFAIDWNYLHDRFPAGNSPETTYDLSIGMQYDF
jgi:putative salt-induced outer membrane protein YdiY